MLGRIESTLRATLLWSCFFLAPYSVGAAENNWSVGRTTNDRDADLIEAFVVRERFDEALELCALLGRDADLQSDRAAKSAIRKSNVLVARQMGSDRFGSNEVDAVSKPVQDLLTAYPDHRRSWFLLTHLATVQRQAALHSVLRAAVSPADDQARDDATRALLSATQTLESLSQEIGDARILLDQQSESRSLGMIEDLGRLQQELQVDTVSLALMQTELFPAGSDDRISAATRAEQIADAAITKLPADTQARSEVERLRVEAILRAGQYDRADQALAPLVNDRARPPSSRLAALRVRLDLAQQRMPQAAAQIDQFYGSQPQAAPRSVAMDLARLEYLLRSDPNAKLGDWFEAIQQRGGVYARRRAEALALSLLGRSGPSIEPRVDPSIIAAQGQDYLRRGDPSRAAELLAAAATAETDSNRAVARAVEAAAAFGKADRGSEAIRLLADVAIAHPAAKNAAAIHLQAVFLASRDSDADVKRLESMLRKNLLRWPASETSRPARSWLVKILAAEGRYLEAAEIATAIPTEQITTADVTTIGEQWSLANANQDDAPSQVSQRFLVAYQPLLENNAAREKFPLLAALFVDRVALGDIRKLIGKGEVDPFAEALLAFRERQTESAAIDSPPADVVGDATQRLMRDGRKNAVLRPAVARLLKRWAGNSDGSLDQAERLLWEGSVDQAVVLIEKMMAGAPRSVETTQRAARLLEQSDLPQAKQEAVRLWDQLAAGAPQGSSTWHRAKLGGIRALRQAGRVDESQRRAKYILLTSPKMSPSDRASYEEFAK